MNGFADINIFICNKINIATTTTVTTVWPTGRNKHFSAEADMTVAAFANLLLNDQPVAKFLVLAGLLLLAVALYWKEIVVLFTTALDLARDLLGKVLKKKA